MGSRARLKKIAAQTNMDIVILRPPLIYGPYVKANFLKLIQIVEKGYPLPFGSITAQRSLLYVGNLTHAIQTILKYPKILNKTFLVSDPQTVTLPTLIRMMATELDCKNPLIHISPVLLNSLFKLLNKKNLQQRLMQSLTINSHTFRKYTTVACTLLTRARIKTYD